MATMTDADRYNAWEQYMRETDHSETFGGFTKADLRAALDAVDQWVSDNSASYNAALPKPCRTALTTQQKARLLLYVAQKRFNVGV